MFTFLLAVYCLLFASLTWKNFRLAVGIFIIGLPTYLIRFKIGPLFTPTGASVPSTLLELMFGILFLVWLIKFARQDLQNIKYLISKNKYLFISLSLFFLASLVSIFISDMWYYSLGQWRAYFLEPMLVFVMLVGRITRPLLPSSPLQRGGGITPSPLQRRGQGEVSPRDLIWFLSLSTVSISVFGILQYFTHWHIGNIDWIALQTGRVTSFFLSPNAVGLYLGPILILAFDLLLTNRTNKSLVIRYSLFVICALALITLLLTKSLGALIAVAIGTLLFAYLVGYKKIVCCAVVLAVLLCLTPPAQNLLANKNQSSSNRLTLWSYTETFLTKSPKNFLLGTGIRQFFRKIQKPYYDVKKMERLIYPHNIFLNFWTEIGLMGMLSFAYLFISLSRIAYFTYKNSDRVLGASLLATLVVFLIHGLIDVPYFKNDLAMLFWIIAAIVISSAPSTVISSEA